MQGFDSLSWNYEIDKNIAITKGSITMQKLKNLVKNIKLILVLAILKEKKKIFIPLL
ncbi:hypothetical protein HMPREF9126_1183 [Parvimonas sp. oral taxon 110 str. F0139]|nr:hypothetical protein HMPREF9126_1183 [Parvimonas sp. oral taxon 110 str. F0139]